MSEISYGYCHCGCGGKTNISRWANRDLKKGEPRKFIGRHGSIGKNNAMWTGGKYVSPQGYVFIYAPSHPRASANKGYVMEHILVVEKGIGRYLEGPELVHHCNRDKKDNSPSNLVLCPDQAYHLMLHARIRALEACGHADWRKCKHCKTYDKLTNLVIAKTSCFHQPCANKYSRELELKRKSLGWKRVQSPRTMAVTCA